MGKALRAFLEAFQKSHRTKEHFDEIRKKGHEILQLAKETKEPHLERETKKFVENLEKFLDRPDQKFAQEVAKSALHLEQETREI